MADKLIFTTNLMTFQMQILQIGGVKGVINFCRLIHPYVRGNPSSCGKVLEFVGGNKKAECTGIKIDNLLNNYENKNANI